MIYNLDEFIKVMKDAIEGEWDGQKLTTVLEESITIFGLINDFCKAHGNISLSCGSEWLFQSDNGRIDALDLVGTILDALEEYAEPEDEQM